jgi:predicted deacylase
MGYSSESIKVGEAGAIEISLPLLKIGSGDPKVLILAGLHGDEITSCFVIARLIERLALKKGGLYIITVANPLAQALNQRWEPISNKDINRAFPGKPEGDFAERLAAKLLELAKECTCVIDFHTFGLQHSLLTAIYMNHGSRRVREQSLELIHTFVPDLIWQLDTRTEEQRRWAGSMGPEMAAQGIINFAVELPETFWAGDEVINRAVDGTLRVLAKLGMIDEAPETPKKQPLMYSRRDVRADQAGVWLPRKELEEALLKGNIPHVTEGELLGYIIDLRTLERKEKKSPYGGLLPSILHRTVVRTGDTLCVIGIEKPWVMLADDTIKKIRIFAEQMDWYVAFGGKLKGNKHLERVAKLATYLSEREPGADRSICQAGAWLHDIGLTVNPKAPASIGNSIAESFLLALEIDEESRGRIIHCIEAHDYGREESKEPKEPRTLEAQIVHDADALDQTGPLGVIYDILKLVNIGQLYSPEEILKVLQKRYDQLGGLVLFTKSGQELAEKLEKLYGNALSEFFADWPKAMSIIAEVMEWAKEGITTEEIVGRLSEKYEDNFTRALKEQIEQSYLR